MEHDDKGLRRMPPEYNEITQRDLDQLIERQRLLGDPRQRVEVPHAIEGQPEPMPVSRRYSMW